jgi:hypothetical protein
MTMISPQTKHSREYTNQQVVIPPPQLQTQRQLLSESTAATTATTTTIPTRMIPEAKKKANKQLSSTKGTVQQGAQGGMVYIKSI